MGCSGCFQNSEQERRARRIIAAKAKEYATKLQKDMVVYKIENEIKFTTFESAIEQGINVEWVVTAGKI